MAIATTAVAVMPVVVVWWLRDAAIVTSPWVCIGLAVAISLAASVIGNAYWRRSSSSGDIFFSELLLWGWLHRFRGERRLAKTAGLLGLSQTEQDHVGAGDHVALAGHGPERTARLLREMAAALDAQDPYTDGHSRRVALHSALVARKLGLERDQIAKIRTAAAVHDIGKLRVPPELLNKPGELSEEEFEIVKRHADDGAKIVSCMEDPEITGMVRHHHERFDGAGYPSGLEGEETPLGARIIAVADTFDALTSVRAYRNAISHKRALDAIVGVSGSQLDPAVVRAFLRCYSANRAALFWALLAVSPQRALASITGNSPGRTNLVSTAASIATPAALAAAVAAAVGSAGGVATARPPLRVAQRTPGQAVSGASTTKPRSSHRPSIRASGPTRVAQSAPKQAVLGVTQSGGGLTAHSLAGGTGITHSGSGSGSGTGSRRGSSRGSGQPAGSPPRKGKGGTPTSSTFTPPPSRSGPPLAVTVPAPSANAPTGPTNVAGGGAGSSSSPPGGPGGSAPGGGSGSSPGTGGNPGGSGGNTGGSGTGPGGSGAGPGSGSGGGSGGGSNEPLTKADCMKGGYANYPFPNQGQCVAYIEHQRHH